MELSIVYKALGVLSGTGFVLGALLGVAYKKFAVHLDPKVEEVREALPGTNDGACGYPGCDALAEAIVSGDAPTNACVVGGHEVAEKLAGIMGTEVLSVEKRVARINCQGGEKECGSRAIYRGADNCTAAAMIAGGGKSCVYGCLGLGSCVRACPFEAIFINEGGIAVVDEERCTGCGVCVSTCSKRIITLVPVEKRVSVLCSSKDRGPVVRKICKIGCIGCAKCVKTCPQEAIYMQDNLAVIDYDKCDNCGACAEACPTNCIADLSREREKVAVEA